MAAMSGGLFFRPSFLQHRKEFPICIPFITAAALAGTFANMGALAVKVSVLTVALQVTSAMLIAVVNGAIALRMDHHRQAR
jgi:hypothetical protein